MPDIKQLFYFEKEMLKERFEEKVDAMYSLKVKKNNLHHRADNSTISMSYVMNVQDQREAKSRYKYVEKISEVEYPHWATHNEKLVVCSSHDQSSGKILLITKPKNQV